MRHVVIARDGTDEDAKARRLRVRPEHLRQIEPRLERGEILLGGPMLDKEGDMVGSVLLVDFPSQEQLDDWLATDPYVTGGVWMDIEVHPWRPTLGVWLPPDEP